MYKKIAAFSLTAIISITAASYVWSKSSNELNYAERKIQIEKCMTQAEQHYNRITNDPEFKRKWLLLVLSNLNPEKLYDAPINTLKKEQEICVKLAS